VDCLPEGLADCFIQLLCLLCGEELVDIEDKLLLELVCKFGISGKDFTVTVIDNTWVSLNHVFLNDCTTGHCVV